MNKVFVTWDQVDQYISDLAESNSTRHWTGVYGIPRGGLVLAVMISHRLHIPFLGAPCEGCLVVDDIADTGRSLLHYTENETQQNRYDISTMYYHERSMVQPNYWYLQKHDDWIIFPWEDPAKG